MNWDLFLILTFVVVIVSVRSYAKRLPVPGAGLSGGDQAALTNAMDVARRLEQRVENLERLLDEDAPGWRARARA
jgi:phage shock protein B